MSAGGGMPGGGPEIGEVHTESPGPIDLAHGHGHGLSHPIHTTHVLRAATPVTGATSVVQIRPVRTFITSGPPGSLIGGKGTTMTLPAGHSSIFVNRTGGPNLTILPRATAGQLSSMGGGSVVSPSISTLQFPRGTILSNVRPTLATGGQPTSITVTPISAANFGTSIRLGSTVNNGSWIQTSGTQGTTFSPIRPTTIQVTSRSIRPDGGKIIHIPQSGTVQHLTQLQVLDKGSILKPTTPISVRGAIHQSIPTNSTGLTLPLAPFTIRAASIQRPPPSVITTASQAQKVITQPAHGPPIIVNAGNQKFTQIQTFSSLPRIPVLSISAPNGGNTVGSTGTLVGLSPRQNNPNVIMSSGGSGQLAKVYPISRDVSTTLVETYINQGHVQVQPTQNHINSPTLTVLSSTTPYTSTIQQPIRPTFVITSTSTSNANPIQPYAHSQTTTQMKGITTPHQLVQVHGPISVQSSAGTLNPINYYIEPKNLPTNVSIFPQGAMGQKRVMLESNEKRTTFVDGHTKGYGPTLVTTGGQMILTSPSTDVPIAGTRFGSLSAHFAHPIQPMQGTTVMGTAHAQIQPHPLTLTKAQCQGVLGAQGQITFSPHSIPTNVISSPALITTCLTTTTTTPTAHTTTNTNIVTLITNAQSSGTAISTIMTSTTTSPPMTGVSSSNSTNTTTTPVQSPSQSKSTLSPRPSILRKREAGACETNFVPLRAQRNLSVNFGMAPVPSGPNITIGSGNNNSNSSSSVNTTTTTPSVFISTVSNKENNSGCSELSTTGFTNTIGNFGLGSITNQNPPTTLSGPPGVSILRKEFQPPNEESSWQSCSSNSSSGSTTLSATSETTELPESSPGVLIPGLNAFTLPSQSLANSTQPLSGLVITRTPAPSTQLLPTTQTPILTLNPIQNGILVRSRGPPPMAFGTTSVPIVSSHPTPVRQRATGQAKGRESKSRKEVVSPRKKPRKQQLTTSDFIESSSPEISFYQAKRFKRTETALAQSQPQPLGVVSIPKGEKVVEKVIPPPAPPPEPAPARIFYILKKPRASLFETNKFVPNLRQNHFQRYSDVKAKDERRPTISDLANQKNVLNKIGGWKLKHLTTQMDQLVDCEVEVVQLFSSLLREISTEDFLASKASSRDLNRIEDLLKGNLQRCKVVRDQMSESKGQVSKVLEHHPRILEVIHKHMSKRPLKKKEKL